MPNLVFTHPTHGDWVIDTGMNEIEWGYTLNTQRFPTYGGEVVQILSCFIEDLTIVGDLPDYQTLENVYNYFVSDIRSATQGSSDGKTPSYDETPITLHYDERKWQIDIRPKEMPGFRYGRDVVVPQWRLVAAVVEQNYEVSQHVYTQAIQKAAQKNKGLKVDGISIDDFLKLPDSIGYRAENPFSNPFPNSSTFDKAQTDAALGELADYFHSLIPSYSSGSFPDLINDGSAPLFLRGGNGDAAGDNPNATATKNKTAPNQHQ